VSDLSDTILKFSPDVWVHGHTHDSCEYILGKTTVISKQAGYEWDREAYFHVASLDILSGKTSQKNLEETASFSHRPTNSGQERD